MSAKVLKAFLGTHLILTLLNSLAQASCEQDISDATLGLFSSNGNGGASATIVAKSFSSDQQKMSLVAYTDFHVINLVCPGIIEGHSCSVHVLSETSCGVAIDKILPVTLDHVYDTESVDVATISIRDIPVAIPNLFSCIHSLDSPNATTYSPSVGATVLRVGYGRRQKSTRRGVFAGFVDINPMFNKAPVPEGSGAGLVPTVKAASTALIEPGDCGGPVVEESSCRLIATSQLGPNYGKSFDIPALLFDRLRDGLRIDQLEASKSLHTENWDVVIHR